MYRDGKVVRSRCTALGPFEAPYPKPNSTDMTTGTCLCLTCNSPAKVGEPSLLPERLARLERLERLERLFTLSMSRRALHFEEYARHG
ncbi:hypothetical protein HBH56_052750 [Parastagonospora nodorum]|uniref:Uncharacterized protein n=1 Tax=Phaeosphaeria nodorum (strain SN15 / ATCC MYA-4574 / FGSC 10173) TaxID=321614 RepID=A0A7U2FBE9_PHANO|nr:hypothetical protein HBH56_052750 [Parastagonospora nodorum]QRD02204.1 hypothetical protein JI435_417670 [Parastagonospora nodorum SN15]KAH3935934.1 hypothetical protein HBH54_038550 [Parastagonospora nodorum]KAH3970013.1 hypothetical protein HBH51_118560 [Parastagonospora nodorum]KAH3997337.1 hypothetical protein HBI10_140820 [Parastagonospora nodorum]